MLVGADGLHLVTRELIFPAAPSPRYTAQRVWRVLVPRMVEFQGRDKGVWHGSDSRAGMTLVSPTEAYLPLVDNSPDPTVPAREAWVTHLRGQLGSFGGVVTWVRETQLEDLSRLDCRPLHALLLPLPWHRDRVVLAGDAAHATTPHLGSGAAIGMEDAVVLADLIRETDDLEAALGQYGEFRFERLMASTWTVSSKSYRPPRRSARNAR